MSGQLAGKTQTINRLTRLHARGQRHAAQQTSCGASGRMMQIGLAWPVRVGLELPESTWSKHVLGRDQPFGARHGDVQMTPSEQLPQLAS